MRLYWRKTYVPKVILNKALPAIPAPSKFYRQATQGAGVQAAEAFERSNMLCFTVVKVIADRVEAGGAPVR